MPRPLVLALCCLAPGLAGCGQPSALPPAFWVRGRVEAPADVELTDADIVCSRDGDAAGPWVPDVPRAWDPRARTFRIPIRGPEPVDVQLGTLAVVTSAVAAHVAEVGALTAQGGRIIHAFRGLEAHVQGVGPASGDIVLRAHAASVHRIVVRAVQPDGAPASGAVVQWRSMADRIEAVADASGVAVLEDVPVRDARLEARPKTRGPLVETARDISAAEAEPLLRLQRGVGILVRLRGQVPQDTYLAFYDSRRVVRLHSWVPSSEGTMRLFVDPTWSSVRVEAQAASVRAASGWSATVLAEGQCDVHEGATLDLVAGR